MSTRTPNTAPAPNRKKRLVASIAAIAVTAGGAGVAYKELSGNSQGRNLPGVTKTKLQPTPKPTTNISPSEKPTKNPVSTIEQLPGYGQRVSPEQRQLMRDSSVEIITSQKDTADPYTTVAFCTGIKVSIGEQNYVATARHCLIGNDDTNRYPQTDTGSGPTLHSVDNLTLYVKTIGKQVSVYAVGTNGNADMSSGVAVTSIAGSYYPDMALLKVNESGSAATKFDALPAIQYESLLGSNAEPGAQAVIYSTPTSTGQQMVETTGTYVGTTTEPGDINRSLAWIAIDGKDAGKDGCYWGGSGSAAYIAGSGITGPLAIRNHPGDAQAEPGEGDRRRELVHALNIDLAGHDTTLCGFSVINPDIVSTMAQVADGQ